MIERCTTLTDADARGLVAPQSEWGGVNGDYANFSFAYSNALEPDYTFYVAPDFKEAIFHHVVTDPITFKNTPFHNSFDGANFRGAQFQKAKLIDFTARWADFSEPQWVPALSEGEFPDVMKRPSMEWEGYDKPPVDFTGAELWSVNFEGSDFTGAQFKDVTTHNHRLTVPVVVPNGVKPDKTKNEVAAQGLPWLRPYRQKVAPVNLTKSNLKNTQWEGTLLNRYAFDTTKVLEQDNAKVNSTELEPSFNFDGAFVDGADFSKARLIIPSSKKEITVEEAIQFVNQNHEEKRTKALEIAEKETLLVERLLIKDRAEKTFIQNMARTDEIKNVLDSLFKNVAGVNQNTLFTNDKELNEKFTQPIKDRIKKDEQPQPGTNPFATFLKRFKNTGS
jgi:uncharacterized protein YjbI with pentapeptide repeats